MVGLCLSGRRPGNGPGSFPLGPRGAPRQRCHRGEASASEAWSQEVGTLGLETRFAEKCRRSLEALSSLLVVLIKALGQAPGTRKALEAAVACLTCNGRTSPFLEVPWHPARARDWALDQKDALCLRSASQRRPGLRLGLRHGRRHGTSLPRLSGKLTDSRRIPKHREETWALGRPGHHERPRRMAGGGRLFREAFSLPADAEPRQQCIHSPRTVRTQQSNSQYVLRGEVTPFYAKEASSLWLGGAAGPGAAAQRGRADACGAPEAPDERYSQHSACVCRCMAVRVPAV